MIRNIRQGWRNRGQTRCASLAVVGCYVLSDDARECGVGDYLLLNKSLIPSMSKLREKRRVWSRGLDLAVAMTYPASSEKALMRKPAPTVKYLRLPLFSASW